MSIEGRSTSIDDESLIEESLKLDLQLSSDSEKTSDKHVDESSSSSSTSSDETASRCQPINWPPTASSDAVVDGFKTTIHADYSPTSSRCQKSSCGRGKHQRTPPSQRHFPAANVDSRKPRVSDVSGRPNSYRSSPKSTSKSGAKASLPRSPCLWRSSASNDEELSSWPGCDPISRDSYRYEYQQSPQPQQCVSPYALRPESSLTDGSRSAFCEAYHEVAVAAGTSQRSPHQLTQSSTLPAGQLVSVVDRGVTSDASDTEPLDADKHYSHATYHSANNVRPDNHFRSDTADDAESSTTRHSRHKHRRSTPVGNHHAASEEPKSPRQHHSRSAKRSDRKQGRENRESTRRRSGGEQAQSSQSAGLMTAAAANAKSGNHRQHSTPACLHEHRRDARRVAGGQQTGERRASSSARGREERRRRHYEHGQRQDSVSATQYTPPDARGRPASRTAGASTSKSADSMSRHHRHGRPAPSFDADYPAPLANQSSGQRRRGRESQSPATLYRCPQQHVRYCSPRSKKPFPPPISDRCPPTPPVDGSAGAAVDAVGDDSDDPQSRAAAGARAPRHQQRHSRSADHHGRAAHAAADPAPAMVGDNGGRRRKKLPATPPVADGGRVWRAVPAGAAAFSVFDRPAWK